MVSAFSAVLVGEMDFDAGNMFREVTRPSLVPRSTQWSPILFPSRSDAAAGAARIVKGLFPVRKNLNDGTARLVA